MPVSQDGFEHYRMFGLRIRSAMPFPELNPAPAVSGADCVDLELDIGGGPGCSSADDLHGWTPLQTVMTQDDPEEDAWLQCARTTEGYRFHFPGLADFLVDHGGCHVTCLAGPETPPETVRHLFLDQVLPPVLNLRGREALHASAIETAGGACAFMGVSGQGKSTLAAAFHVAGHRVLSDDCLVIKNDSERILVEPAYPGLRLWDDSRVSVFGDLRPSRTVSHYSEKRRIVTSEPEAANGEAFALQGFYALIRNAAEHASREPVIERVSVRDALMELISCAFRLDLTDQAMILRQMSVLERVARLVPVKRLRMPDDLAALPRARELILRDLQRGS